MLNLCFLTLTAITLLPAIGLIHSLLRNTLSPSATASYRLYAETLTACPMPSVSQQMTLQFLTAIPVDDPAIFVFRSPPGGLYL